MTIYSLLGLALITLTLNICGCSGGSTETPPSTVQTTTVQGVAAAGDPISGTVYLKCVSNFQNYSVVSAKITDAGEYSIDTTGLTPPFILKTSNNSLFSYANGPGTVNINPLTTVAVAVAAGATDINSLTAMYTNGFTIDQTQIVNAASNITGSLQDLLMQYHADSADFMSGNYVANHQGLDDLFDKIAINISDGKVAITSKETGSKVFDASLNDIANGTLTPTNAPVPTQYDMPGNASLTLKIQGTLPQGTLIKNVSFSIKLPLGVTVVTTPSLESGPAVVNTTIPIETAAKGGAHSTATLSATNGILSITMSSVAGFGTGDFLTIRYTDSSSYFMHKRTPADFVISGSLLFSDIYKNQKMQNLAIVPVSITFP